MGGILKPLQYGSFLTLIEAVVGKAKVDDHEKTYRILKTLPGIHKIEKLPPFNTERETFEMAGIV